MTNAESQMENEKWKLLRHFRLTALNKDEFIAPQPGAAEFQFGQGEAAFAVKVENLFGRCEFVWIAADPIHDVPPTAHAAKVVRLDPRAQIFAGTAVERGS